MIYFSANDLMTYKVQGIDDIIGDAKGFLFDSKSWMLKYLVVKRGFWPFEKEFYIPINHVGIPDNLKKMIPIELSKEQIEDENFSSSNKMKIDALVDHPIKYWRAGKFPYKMPWLDPFAISSIFKKRNNKVKQKLDNGDEIIREVRSLKGVSGYCVDAKDKNIGRVKNFIIDAEDWIISYVIVEGEDDKVLLPSQWITNLNPIAESIKVNLLRESVLESPYVIK